MRSLKVAVAAALVVLSASPASAEPVNQSPVAVDDAVTYRNYGGVDYPVAVLANDSDADGDPLTVTAVTPAAKGNAYLRDGTVFYKPYFGESGSDSFTYTVSDGQGNTATATVRATLWLDPAMPGSPFTITIPAPGSATLTWSAATRADQYRIYRDDRLVHTTSELTWTDSGLLDESYYSYRVAGVNGGGWEGPSQRLYRERQRLTPTALAVTPIDDPTAVSLTWEAGGQWGPWLVFRDGVHVATTREARFEESGLVTGREYSYQVQLVDAPSPNGYDYDVSPDSPLSEPVRATPAPLTPIARFFMERGAARSDLGSVTVPERAVPGGRQQDHVNGIVVQKDGGDPYAVLHYFATAYAAVGGVSGDLGFPLMELECGLRDGGCGQLFEGGSIWSWWHLTHAVLQVIEDGWAAAGWEEGPLGYPVGDQVVLPGGLSQPFQDGGVYWSAVTGSHGVAAETHDTYAAWGGPTGRLGFPTTGDNCGLRGDGCWQAFQGGTIHWSPATGAHVTDGMIRDAWARTGWENGRLGYPTTDAVCGLRGGGCWQGFQGGTIHWSPATGARVTDGAMRDAWARAGWKNGRLGYPTTDANCGLRGGGCWQGFQGGTIHWSPATGAHATDGAMRDAWARTGWENGRLGYPTTDAVCGLRGGGCWQGFQGGTIHWSPATGAHATDGAMRGAWARAGWENGRLGYPTTDAVCGLRGGGCWQDFQGGTIHWSPTTGAHATDGAMRGAWARAGWENGRLGYPTTDATCGLRGGGCWQGFQGGTIHWSPASGAHATSGAIRDAWAREGWENGRLGYPVGMEGMGLSSGGIRQRFQGGEITVDQRTGRVTVR
ncbi:Ig-like domain-containing protein [Blastococcus montanus]|uniref:Ig-like domain-containing protein n=1 Tax=Blastococcus montanus TaxID=3144973 RepID=UPI00320865A2